MKLYNVQVGLNIPVMASSPEEAEQIAKKNLSNELDCCDLSAREAQKNYQYDNSGNRLFIVWWCRPTTEAEKQHWDKEVAAKQKKALADKLRRAKRKEKLELKEREQLRLLKAKYEK